MKNRDFTKDLTKTVLITVGIGVIIPALVVAPGLGYALKPLLKKINDNDYHPTRIRQTVKRLEKQQLISIKEEKGKTRIELLDKGKKRVLLYNLEKMELKKGRWDGYWRVVIFDIPEKKKVARNFLRYKLKDLNFYPLQKSVLVTPWDCKEAIDFVKHYYEVGDFVSLILAKKIDEQEKLKRYFDV